MNIQELELKHLKEFEEATGNNKRKEALQKKFEKCGLNESKSCFFYYIGNMGDMFVYRELSLSDSDEYCEIRTTDKNVGEFAMYRDYDLFSLSFEKLQMIEKAEEIAVKYLEEQSVANKIEKPYCKWDHESIDLGKADENGIKEYEERLKKLADETIQEALELIKKCEEKRRVDIEEAKEKLKLQEKGIEKFGDRCEIHNLKKLVMKEGYVYEFKDKLIIENGVLKNSFDNSKHCINLEGYFCNEDVFKFITAYFKECDITFNGKTLKITFEGDSKRIKIDGESCQKQYASKVVYAVLNKNADLKKTISLYKELGVRKQKVTEIKKLDCRSIGKDGLEVPVTITPKNKDYANVKIGDKEVEVSFESLMKRFMSGNSVYIYMRGIEYLLEMGFDKKYLFEYFSQLLIEKEI